MKKFLCFALSIAFLLSCLLAVGCSISSSKVYSYADETLSFLPPVDPIGLYQLDSIALLEDGRVSAAGVGTEWEGQILTDHFAGVLIKEDGSFVCSGALQGKGHWLIGEDGVLSATGSLNEGDLIALGIDSRGLLHLEVVKPDGSLLTLCFAK